MRASNYVHRLSYAWLIILLSVAGCAHSGDLVPALGAKQLAGERGTVVASDAGVRVIVRPGAWDENPPNLADAALPLHVTIENRSAHPLALRHSTLKLRGPALDYAPLDAQQLVKKTVLVKEDPLILPRTGAEPLTHIPHPLRSLSVKANPEAPPYERYYAEHTVALPTLDMIDRALPQRVLQPGERASGFLYFEPLRPEVHRARFTYDLIDARSALTFGHIEADFVVR
jgi:hypothetical protein